MPHTTIPARLAFALTLALALAVGLAVSSPAHAQQLARVRYAYLVPTVVTPEVDEGRGGDFLFQLHLGGGFIKMTDGVNEGIAPVGAASAYFGLSFDAPSERSVPGMYFSMGYQASGASDGSAILNRHQVALTMRLGSMVETIGLGMTNVVPFEGGDPIFGGSLSATTTFYFGSSAVGFSLPFHADVIAYPSGPVVTYELSAALTFGNF
jgi:hypothetical protein